MEAVETSCIYSEATLLSGKTVTLGPCRTVRELKVRACQQFSIANFIILMISVFRFFTRGADINVATCPS